MQVPLNTFHKMESEMVTWAPVPDEWRFKHSHVQTNIAVMTWPDEVMESDGAIKSFHVSIACYPISHF